MVNLSNADLERTYLLFFVSDPDENSLSNADLRNIAYSNQQTPYPSDPVLGLSATDVEIAQRRLVSGNPLKDSMSLADLRREAWGG